MWTHGRNTPPCAKPLQTGHGANLNAMTGSWGGFQPHPFTTIHQDFCRRGLFGARTSDGREPPARCNIRIGRGVFVVELLAHSTTGQMLELAMARKVDMYTLAWASEGFFPRWGDSGGLFQRYPKTFYHGIQKW